MAWSDAARRAAALVRRSRAKGKVTVPGYGVHKDFTVTRHQKAKALMQARREGDTGSDIYARGMAQRVGANMRLAQRKGVFPKPMKRF